MGGSRWWGAGKERASETEKAGWWGGGVDSREEREEGQKEESGSLMQKHAVLVC